LAILCYSQSDVQPQEDLARFGYKLFLEFFFVIARVSGYDPQEDVARFGYKLNMELKHTSIFLAALL
jgi:hypothetical protein